MVRAVYKHTDARDRVTPIIKIRLNEDVDHWSVLGEIGNGSFLSCRWSRKARSNEDAGSVRSDNHAYCSS
jgi:hypothetical protein